MHLLCMSVKFIEFNKPTLVSAQKNAEPCDSIGFWNCQQSIITPLLTPFWMKCCLFLTGKGAEEEQKSVVEYLENVGKSCHLVLIRSFKHAIVHAAYSNTVGGVCTWRVIIVIPH